MADENDNCLISISDLTFTYPGAIAPSLNKISFRIQEGDFLAISGNNGSGKTTLCKVMNGLIPQYIMGDISGSVQIQGVDVIRDGVDGLEGKAGYVYQDFDNQILCPVVLDDACFTCLNSAMPDYRQRGKNALELTGLSHKEQDYIWQLSGGEKHLLALAGSLAPLPKLLLLDEPIAQLDGMHAKKIYNLLRFLNTEKGITIIVVEHHTEFIAEYCKHMLLINNGKVLWKMPAKDALRQVDTLLENNIYPPQITIAASRISSPPKGKLPVTLTEGFTYFSQLKNNNQHQITQEQNCCIPQIIFNQVSAEYRGIKKSSRKIIHSLNLTLFKGEKIAIIGNNGAGKSTFLKLIAGFIRPSEGEVLINNRTTEKDTIETIGKYVSFVLQNPEEMFIADNIRDDIEYAMLSGGTPNYSERVERLLIDYHLESIGGKDGRMLSGGQARRASLAIGVAMDPLVLLLDEPTANLDITSRDSVIRCINQLDSDISTIIATHDMQLVCEWADRVIVLHNGAVLADGTKEKIFSDESLLKKAGIMLPEIYRMAKMLDPNSCCFSIERFINLYV